MRTVILILTVAEFTILIIYQTTPASCLTLNPLPPKKFECDHRDFYHFEEDITNSDQLLVSSMGALGVFNTNSEEYHDIIGSGRLGYVDGYMSYAEFNWITGFRQINSTHVLLADHDNHCIRLVDRVAQRATTLAGKCKEFGHKDGSMEESRFYRPYNIINASGEDDYYITDYQNQAIRILSLGSEKISTFYNSRDNLLAPISMFLDAEMLYVTLAYDVVFINTTGGIANLTDVRKNERLNKICRFDDTTLWLFSNPEESPRQNFIMQIKTTPGSNNNISFVLDLPRDVKPQAAVLKKNGSKETLYIGQNEFIRNSDIQDKTLLTTTTTQEILDTTTTRVATTSWTTETEQDNSKIIHLIINAVVGVTLILIACALAIGVLFLRRRRWVNAKGHEDPTNDENLRNCLVEMDSLTNTALIAGPSSTAQQETTHISMECEESCETFQAIENEDECVLTVDLLNNKA